MEQHATTPPRGGILLGMSSRVRLALVSSGLALLAGCSSSAQPLPPNALTVAPVATQVAAVRSGAATPSGTALALATQLAPTIQVVQQTVGPIATSVARSPVHITGVNVTSDDTTIVVQNSGSAPVNLQGWTLLLGPNIPITLQNVQLAPGQTRTLHTAMGTDTDSDVYLNIASVGSIATTFAPGQRAVLVGPDNQIASVFGTG
ncbi:MAG: lamin tail domain-containing protein [Chloroflexi bacterium]|nr:lamin tail domain-containing protein [Chloroflexota bacterium]MBV9600817.1 lamin tail domain-containing protein [Chloroflexota bacterium]